MGINELLKIIRPQIVEKHISEFSGKTAAVDMMAWIYRGAYASAVDVGQGKKSDLYLNFPMKMLALLKSHNIDCIAVFDGKKLKAKELVEEQRNENKNKNLEQAKRLEAQGREEESRKIYRRALKIKSRMINSFIEIFKYLGVRHIVAPYEADSQIAFLCKSGMADFAITEDSDLIPFGVDCIAYKLDANGNFSYLDMKAFRNLSIENISDPQFRQIKKIFYDHLRLVEFCVMLGCDYLPSIKGLGFKTALSLFESYEKLDRVLNQMKFIDKFKKNLPDKYSENVKKCVSLFFLQTVFNPIDNKLQPLNDLIIYDTDSSEQASIKEYLTKTKIENCDDFLGSLHFDNFKEFCKGNLDVKTCNKVKKLEDDKVIQKYVNRFKNVFKVSSFISNNETNSKKDENNNLKDFDKDGQMYDKEELEQFINFDEFNEENYIRDLQGENENKENFKNTTENDFVNSYRNENNYLGKSNLIINKNLQKIDLTNDEDDLEMQYYLAEIAKKEKLEKKKNTQSSNFSSSNQNNNDDEIKNILKLCASLTESENNEPSGKKVEIGTKFNTPNKLNDQNKEGFINLFKGIKSDNSSSEEKHIKDLFDIIEKEKQEINEENNIISDTKDLKLPVCSRTVISPNFCRIMSPYKPIINSDSQSPFKSSNKATLFSQTTNPFSQKSPDWINPNMNMKRKYNEILPKALEFNHKNKLEEKSTDKNMNILSFMNKKLKNE